MKDRKPRVCIASNFYSDTKYEVVTQSVKALGWSTTVGNDWDIMWRDGSVPLNLLSQMKLLQKVNHFPGMFEISRKNCLAKNLNNFREAFPEDYDFYPQTWVLPADISSFKSALKCNSTLIIKPDASSQGKGIYLINKPEDIQNVNNCIAQRYIKNPLLIDGLKFDLRIYVLIAGCDPLRIYIYEEGLARFATQEYVPPTDSNLQDRFMHLTNYSVNKLSEKFVQNAGDDKNCHKRSLSSVLKVKVT